ncbi:hypothetical protein N7532_002987 [Penicillium argentinense]|uniref:NWD NACHT-NTPase N-terminal domain-containing protein n=1 Tax=Penicillium argentinense TaxID=1131581 RepID=A0A9W9FLK4_9EURO|nr:uncharacterized protein N7532_002987 [Penicillium argentinense]KAJ5102458.1 hypothetical protein N7532_002987 [Penicillium argentinense]
MAGARGFRAKLRNCFRRKPKNAPNDIPKAPPEDTFVGNPLTETKPVESVENQFPKHPPQQVQPIPDNSRPFNLWQRAEDKLNASPDTQELLQASYQSLTAELGEELQPIGTAARQAQLDRLFQCRADALEKEKWTIQFGDHEVGVQDMVSSAFEKVLMVKDLIDTAASASPPAALACAGLSVVFTLVLQATGNQAILLETLEYTSDLMCRYQVMEDVHRSDANAPKSAGNQADLLGRFEDHLTDLYAAILEFHARAMNYLGKRSVIRLFSDAFDVEGWSSVLQGIKNHETRTEKDAQMIGAANVDQRLRAIQNTQQYEANRQAIAERDRLAMKLLQTLYTCPYKDRKDVNHKRVPGTCEWFTHHRMFENWQRAEGSSLLWVSADPGCGKSVLAKYLIDDLLPATKESTICYFFFKDGILEQMTATSAVCAILRQTFLSQPHLLSDHILNKFAADGENLIKSFSDLWSIFTSMTADPSMGETICILDALDECQDDERGRLIEAVTRSQQGGVGSGKVKFLVTSRPYSYIYRDFQGVQEDLSTVHLSGEGEEEIGQITKEIDLVIQKRVEDISRKRGLTSEQCQMLLHEIKPVANRTYLWVTLAMDVIAKTPGFTKGNIRTAMKRIPSTVNDAYEEILSRTPAPDRAKTILHAILAATRPLSVSEMALAVAVDQAREASEDVEDYLESAEEFQNTLREICGLFVVVIHSQVYLLHQTAREFLVQSDSNTQSGTSTWKASIDLQDSNRVMAELCTWCLVSDQSEESAMLKEYSTQNWMTHFKSCNVKSEDSLTPLARQLCEPGQQHLWDNALMFAYRSDLAPVVEYLIKVEKAGVDYPSPTGRTVLAYAAQEGRADIVKMILEHAINASSRSRECAIPLLLSIAYGHVDIVQLLLDYGADATFTNGFGNKPICLAARQGDENVVNLLIKHGADVNTRDLQGRTPLSLAKKHIAVCQMLISHGANAIEDA